MGYDIVDSGGLSPVQAQTYRGDVVTSTGDPRTNDMRNKLVTVCLDGDFPFKLGTSLQYKREKAYSTGIFLGVVPNRNCIVMLLHPRDPQVTHIFLPKEIHSLKMYSPSEDNILEWRSFLEQRYRDEQKLLKNEPKQIENKS